MILRALSVFLLALSLFASQAASTSDWQTGKISPIRWPGFCPTGERQPFLEKFTIRWDGATIYAYNSDRKQSPIRLKAGEIVQFRFVDASRKRLILRDKNKEVRLNVLGLLSKK